MPIPRLQTRIDGFSCLLHFSCLDMGCMEVEVLEKSPAADGKNVSGLHFLGPLELKGESVESLRARMVWRNHSHRQNARWAARSVK